jgi:ATP-binding protein involved in chromosome partitioning
MFKQVNAPLLGIVENMSFFICPDCGSRSNIFRQGGGGEGERALGDPLLGRVPLDPAVCDAGDTGVPLVIGQPDTAAAGEFRKIAAAVVEVLSSSPRRAPIKIIN